MAWAETRVLWASSSGRGISVAISVITRSIPALHILVFVVSPTLYDMYPNNQELIIKRVERLVFVTIE